jgi:hypothetical protein
MKRIIASFGAAVALLMLGIALFAQDSAPPPKTVTLVLQGAI